MKHYMRGGKPGAFPKFNGVIPHPVPLELFDPFGLSKPVEYLQFDLDSLDGSAAVNPIGQVIGKLKKVDNAPTERTIVVRKNAISSRRGLARWQLPPRSTRPETGARNNTTTASIAQTQAPPRTAGARSGAPARDRSIRRAAPATTARAR